MNSSVFFDENCWLYVESAVAHFASAGGLGVLRIHAMPGCAWTADGVPDWVSFRTIPSGSGSADLDFTVAPNGQTSGRYATVSIGDHSILFVQDGMANPISEPLRFVPMAPCRLVETRPEYNYEGRTGAFGPPALRLGELRTLIPSASSLCEVPVTAKAFVLNFTVVPTSSTAKSGIEVRQELNFSPVVNSIGPPAANSVIVKSDTNLGFQVHGYGNEHMIIDITGYFTDETRLPSLVYYPLAPCRAVDTRVVYRPQAGPFGPPSLGVRETRRFHLRTAPDCTIPPNASAYAMNMTVVPKGPLAFLTAWPSGGPQPNVSSLNSQDGQIVTNSVIIPAGEDGSIDVFAYDQTDLLIDINGYFAPDDGKSGLFYHPLEPCDVMDISNPFHLYPFGAPAMNAAETRTIPVDQSTICSISAPGARAYSASFRVSPDQGQPMPFLTAWPAGQPRPNVSQLNAFDGQHRINSAIIPSGEENAINIFVYAKTGVAMWLNGFFGR